MMPQVTFKEAKKLVSFWGKGTFPSAAESIKYHFARHGREVSAQNVWQYLRKAFAFNENLRGARTSEIDVKVVRYMKSGYYIIKDEVGKCLSYEAENI